MVPVHVAVVRAGAEARLRNGLLLAGLVLWLVYTRVFWPLTAAHATLPACPFRTITGHPCPLCGGTHSFAFMWDGDVTRAALAYPLGPLLFVGTLVAVPVLAFAVIADRDLAVRLPDSMRRALLWAGLAVMAVSWSLKLTVLPN